ncbi:hypothetical protein [Nonomuraea longicatena]|uniref:Acyltransferase PapA5 n=1 Tax=Nonomuraea longicatena TaxID=83682 RepID=A0ABP3ZUS8_9ACTN
MTRLLEPSEVFHAFLDWQTGFEVEVPAQVTPDAAARALERLYAGFPRLAAGIGRTPDGFAFEPGSATVERRPDGARVHATLSAFDVDLSQPDVVRVAGRLHHALCDVTGILSMADELLGLLGAGPHADSIPPEVAREWPIAAETLFGPEQPADAVRATRLFYAQAGSPSLKPAQPISLTLSGERAKALDDRCDVSLTALIAATVAPLTHGDTDRVTIGVPVDCRVYIGTDRTVPVPPRAIGNGSHGALVPIARGSADVLATASAFDDELMDQLEAATPTAPFRDGRRYLPEHNGPAHLVVSNARGAARRFPRLADARKVIVLPEVSIPGMPMIAVNESPATRAVVITVIADPADHTSTDVRQIVDTLARALDGIGER